LFDAENTRQASPLIRRLTGTVLAVAAALAVLVGASPAQAQATASPAAGLPYVALGDSYAAGYGLKSPTDKPTAECNQSALDYPHQVAEKLDLRLTDVSCSGATTADVVSAEQFGAAPQAEALSSRTRVVTISIGGNDAGLFTTASSCIALTKNGPVFSEKGTATCKQTLVTDGQDSLADKIDQGVSAGLATAFRTIREKAPRAEVFVIGYPAIFPDQANTPTDGCFRPVVGPSSLLGDFPKNGFPFTATDVAYLGGVQRDLDKATGKAAQKAGFHYVSTLAASESHSGCATDDSYIAGVTLSASDGLRSISLAPGALHPNDAGATFLAAQTASAIDSAFTKPAPSPNSASEGLDPIWFVAGGALVAGAVALVVFAVRRRRRVD
jgi:lysophospholipase L1-like esterase